MVDCRLWTCGYLIYEPPPQQLIGGEITKLKCVDDNPTIVGSIVDCDRRFFGAPGAIHVYDGVACVLRIERGVKVAITMIILSMMK